MDSGITVIGYGLATAPADLLRITMGIGTDAADVATAVDTVGGLTKAVIAALHDAGVGADDIQTSAVSVYPNYGHEPMQVQGYRASHQLVVTSRELEGFGRLLNAAVDAAGNDIALDHLAFDVEDKSALQVQARQAAFEDARARADHLAGLAGRDIGALDGVEETGSHGPIVPRAAGEGVSLAFGTPAEIAVEPGEESVTVGLTVRWSWA